MTILCSGRLASNYIEQGLQDMNILCLGRLASHYIGQGLQDMTIRVQVD